jgi:hypothetical protein
LGRAKVTRGQGYLAELPGASPEDAAAAECAVRSRPTPPMWRQGRSEGASRNLLGQRHTQVYDKRPATVVPSWRKQAKSKKPKLYSSVVCLDLHHAENCITLSPVVLKHLKSMSAAGPRLCLDPATQNRDRAQNPVRQYSSQSSAREEAHHPHSGTRQSGKPVRYSPSQASENDRTSNSRYEATQPGLENRCASSWSSYSNSN